MQNEDDEMSADAAQHLADLEALKMGNDRAQRAMAREYKKQLAVLTRKLAECERKLAAARRK